MGLLSALGLLALAPMRGTLRAAVTSPLSSSSATPTAPPAASGSSPTRNPSTRKAPSSRGISSPEEVGSSPSQTQANGVLTARKDGDEGGAGAAAGIPGAASAPGAAQANSQQQPERREELREEASHLLSGGGLGEGVDGDGEPRCWTDEEGRGRCLPTVFFFGVSKCGEHLRLP